MKKNKAVVSSLSLLFSIVMMTSCSVGNPAPASSESKSTTTASATANSNAGKTTMATEKSTQPLVNLEDTGLRTSDNLGNSWTKTKVTDAYFNDFSQRCISNTGARAPEAIAAAQEICTTQLRRAVDYLTSYYLDSQGLISGDKRDFESAYDVYKSDAGKNSAYIWDDKTTTGAKLYDKKPVPYNKLYPSSVIKDHSFDHRILGITLGLSDIVGTGTETIMPGVACLGEPCLEKGQSTSVLASQTKDVVFGIDATIDYDPAIVDSGAVRNNRGIVFIRVDWSGSSTIVNTYPKWDTSMTFVNITN